MLGIRDISSPKALGLILIIGLIILFIITKNSQAVMRAMVGQEISWRTASFNIAESEHFIIKYSDEDIQYIDEIAAAADKSYLEVTKIFAYSPDKKTTIVVYPDAESLAQSFGWDKNEQAMGVYWAGSIRILSPGAWLTYKLEDEFYREGPMVHEFAHLLIDDLTKGNYNRWWTEGVAQYVEKRVTSFQFDNPFVKGKPFNYYEIKDLEKSFDKLDQSIAYWESLQLVEYLVDNYGEDKIFLTLEYLGQGNSMANALERATGKKYHTFINDFYNMLEKNY